jgi:hypothetical protein
MNMKETAGLTASLKAVSAILTRLNSVKDPALKYSLFVQQLAIFSDVGIAVARSITHDKIEETTSDLEEHDAEEVTGHPERHARARDTLVRTLDKTQALETLLDEVAGQYGKYLDDLTDWIQSPTYAPDHPVGRAMMAAAAADIQKHSGSKSDEE